MSVDVRVQSKLPSVGTTIFTVMSRLASDLGAINLSQGFPDFDGPEWIVEAAAEAALISRTTAYRYFPNQRALLAAAHGDVDAPGIHLERHAAE